MTSLFNDILLGARTLLKERAFTLAVVVTLALGIAANNTVFTVINGVLLRAMPFDEPDRILELGAVSYLDLQDWRAASRALDGIGASDEQTFHVSDDAIAAERYLGAFITANAFGLIGQRPILGRDFLPDDDRAGAAPVVILGYPVWRNRYAADPTVIGRTIRVNGVPSTVVGVMAEGFGFPQSSQVWQPMALGRAAALADRSANVLDAFGRLPPGGTLEQARGELSAIAARLARDYPDRNRESPRVALFRSGVGVDTGISMIFLFMMGAVAFVLLIACANVANLLLLRAAERTREVSMRLSLGASRSRIVRQLLAESLLLAAGAGVLGLALSFASIRVLWRTILQTGDPVPYWMAFPIDGRVLAFLVAVCLGTAVLSGLAPAWLASRASLVELLNDAGRGSTGGIGRRRWTGAFVIGQLTLTLVLLSGAGLMMRGLLAQVRADAGVDTSTLVTMRLDLPAPAYAAAERRQAFFAQLEEDLSSLPGMRVSFASEIPMNGAPQRRLLRDGDDSRPADSLPVVGQMTIGTRYFDTLGTRAVRGRMFGHADADGDRVAIVNERLAEMYFPGEDPIGRRLALRTIAGPPPGGERPPAWLTIVGVAPNVRQRPTESGSFDPLVYVPVRVSAIISTFVIVRSELAPGAVVSVLRERLRALDPDLPLFDARTVNQQLAFERWPQRVFGSMFAAFAVVALLLAAVGLYAVTAYAASQRTREIGVRVALGAKPTDVWWLVSRRAATQLAFGVLLGSAGAIAVARILPSRLTGLAGNDPATMAAATLLLVVIGLAAAFVPAHRATRIQPMDALRAE